MGARLGDLSVREKNLWFDLLVDIVVALYYYPRAFGLMRQGDEELSGATMTGLIVNTIILAVIISVVLQVFLHIKSKPEPRDERDLLINAMGSIWFGRLMIAGVLFVVGQIVLMEFFPMSLFYITELTPLIIGHLLLVVVMLSSLAKSVIKLLLYRIGF